MKSEMAGMAVVRIDASEKARAFHRAYLKVLLPIKNSEMKKKKKHITLAFAAWVPEFVSKGRAKASHHRKASSAGSHRCWRVGDSRGSVASSLPLPTSRKPSAFTPSFTDVSTRGRIMLDTV